MRRLPADRFGPLAAAGTLSAMKRRGGPATLALGVIMLLAAGCSSAGSHGGQSSPGTGAAGSSATASAGADSGTSSVSHVPSPVHTVVVMMENHAYSEVLGSSAAPYLNQLAGQGAVFTRSFAVTHPSQPNYLALFSGSTQGVVDDNCPVEVTAPNLASDLIAASKTFAGYSEGLPATGSETCGASEYARKHVPWTDFRNVPGSVNRPFSSFPSDFSKLPTVSFVIPNLCDDMHDCAVSTGDSWLKTHIAAYARWAMTHDSLLIITWDENDGGGNNQIPTIFVGQLVRPGKYSVRIDHYTVLATIEAAYGLPRDGHAAIATPITNIWQR